MISPGEGKIKRQTATEVQTADGARRALCITLFDSGIELSPKGTQQKRLLHYERAWEAADPIYSAEDVAVQTPFEYRGAPIMRRDHAQFLELWPKGNVGQSVWIPWDVLYERGKIIEANRIAVDRMQSAPSAAKRRRR